MEMKGAVTMETPTSNLPEILLSVMLGSVFAVLCLTLKKVFEQMELYEGKWALLLAALTSILAVTGAALLLLLPSSAAETRHVRSISVNYSLWPALAVAGTVILLQLFIVAATPWEDKAAEGPDKQPAGQPMKQKVRPR
jgi:hypothetical protein